MNRLIKQIPQFYLAALMFLFGIQSCEHPDSSKVKEISFYHWKSKAIYTPKIEETLNQSQAKKIYIHYFDVEQVNKPKSYDNGAYPTYVIKEIDSNFTAYDIVPVVYITNEVFKSEYLDVEKLASRVKELVNQISLEYFKKEIKTIQIDCDWTQSTKNTYFDFLKVLQPHFEIDVTIRLHQIKFKEKTGIPPVKHGTLMLYNMGDFRKSDENSILESNIVSQYISTTTNYPFDLHIGLPLFSQTVLSNKDKSYKLIKDVDRQLYENDAHFAKIDTDNFKVVKDTLYKGFYLTPGFNLKLEELNIEEIIKSYRIIEKSELNLDEIIFYHLDDNSLQQINVKKLINEL